MHCSFSLPAQKIDHSWNNFGKRIEGSFMDLKFGNNLFNRPVPAIHLVPADLSNISDSSLVS